MDQLNKRDAQKAKSETRDPRKPKRFKLVRLEERIAPSTGAKTGTAPLSASCL
jgi:hypothetical protein